MTRFLCLMFTFLTASPQTLAQATSNWVTDAEDTREIIVKFVGSTVPYATAHYAGGSQNASIVGGRIEISNGGSWHFNIGSDYLFSDEYNRWSWTGRVIVEF